jgi:hypothetical protein
MCDDVDQQAPGAQRTETSEMVMVMRKKNSPWVLAMVALLALGLWSVQASAQAKGKGALFVDSFFSKDDLANMGGASAEIYVYGADGKLISSGMGNGSWAPGALIEVPPGDYLVEVGRHRSRQNLRRYAVKEGYITPVKTGWLSVTTWPQADQPKGGCQSWDAQMRAYVVDEEGKEHLVSTSEARGKSQSRIQLMAGKYRVYWHGLATDVEVVEDKILHLGTGGVGPLGGSSARVSAQKSDKGGVPSVELCADGPTHILAGKWWVSQVEKIEEYPYEKRVWQQIEVPALDESFTRDLRGDRLRGRLLKGQGQGQRPSAQELKALAGYKEGTLKKTTRGGKFDFDTNPF